MFCVFLRLGAPFGGCRRSPAGGNSGEGIGDEGWMTVPLRALGDVGERADNGPGDNGLEDGRSCGLNESSGGSRIDASTRRLTTC